MMKTKFMNGIILGLCVSLLSAGTALAAEIKKDTPVTSDVEERYVGDDLELKEDEMGITSATGEPERYVGDDLELKEGEMGITSATGEPERYVGDDLELKEGEMGITSVTNEAERYVGDDLELKEGEMGITSVTGETERYVGDDVVLKDGEFGITSVGNDNVTVSKINRTTLILSVILGGVILISGVVFIKNKNNKRFIR